MQWYDKVKPGLRQTDVAEQNLKAKDKFSVCADVFGKKSDRNTEQSETCKIVWKVSYSHLPKNFLSGTLRII